MVAGAWVLVLVPVISALKASGWASRIPVPTVFDFRGTVRTLDDTLICWPGVYQPLMFCIGVVLLFSNERGRRPAPLDWTRRWGVICSYVVLLLSAAGVLIVVALVMAGIAALFQGMPLKYQPGVTRLFVELSSTYLRYGPQPMYMAAAVHVAFSSIAMLLACIPLFDALRSSGSKRLAAMLLAPLVLFALMHLGQVVQYCLGFSGAGAAEVFRYGVYFWPDLLVRHIAELSGAGLAAGLVEVSKWGVVLAIAVWMSVAQVVAWRHQKKTSTAEAARHVP